MNHLTATGNHTQYGITQCYLPYRTAVTFPTLFLPKLVLDLPTPEGCKAELMLMLIKSQDCFSSQIRLPVSEITRSLVSRPVLELHVFRACSCSRGAGGYGPIECSGPTVLPTSPTIIPHMSVMTYGSPTKSTDPHCQKSWLRCCRHFLHQ